MDTESSSLVSKLNKIFPPMPKNSSDRPIVGQIYGGEVISVTKRAIFVRLNGFGEIFEGSLSQASIGDGNITDFKRTMNLFVKVLSISDKDSLTLSTKDVDQKTGQELEMTRIEFNNALPDILRRRKEKSPASQQQKLRLEADLKLYYLGATRMQMKQTNLGEKMAKFAVGPVQSRILMAGVDFKCSHQALIVAAMTDADPTYFKRQDQEMASFFRPGGDHLTLLAVYKAWKAKKISNNFFLIESLKKTERLIKKLVKAMNGMGLEIVSTKIDDPMIRKAITAGLFLQSARWDPQEDCYRTLVDENRRVHIHPHSALFREEPPRFVVHDAICLGEENKEYMTGVTAIDPKWLVEVAPRFFKEAGPSQSSGDVSVREPSRGGV